MVVELILMRIKPYKQKYFDNCVDIPTPKWTSKSAVLAVCRPEAPAVGRSEVLGCHCRRRPPRPPRPRNPRRTWRVVW